MFGRLLLGLFAAAFLHIAAAASPLETYAEFGRETPPGNIAIGPDGRVFISLHGFFGEPIRVAEVAPDGTVTPYPPGWAKAPVGDGPGLYGVLGLQVDRQGILWLLDGAGAGHAGRLVAWDTRTETLHRIIYLAPPVIRPHAFLNDLAVDRSHGAVYITDTATPETSALIVMDLHTGRARRVLEGSPFTRPEDFDLVIDGAPSPSTASRRGSAPTRSPSTRPTPGSISRP